MRDEQIVYINTMWKKYNLHDDYIEHGIKQYANILDKVYNYIKAV